jgi:hypothetical protein
MRTRPTLAPQLRGWITPRTLAGFVGLGFTAHRVGRAVYLHDAGGLHLLLGVWERRDPTPPWASRLGQPSAGYVRRVERCEREQRGRLMGRDPDGRFAYRRPWWRVPGPVVYSHEPHRQSWYEQTWGRV